MATAMRAVAAKLKHNFPVAVQRSFASSQAPETATNVGRLDIPESRHLDEHLKKMIKKHRRNDYLACIVGFSIGALLFKLGVDQLKSI